MRGFSNGRCDMRRNIKKGVHELFFRKRGKGGRIICRIVRVGIPSSFS